MSAAFFKAETLADLYQIPRRTIWQYLRQGEFKGALKIGKTYRIPNEAKIEFEKRHLVNAKSSK